MVEHSHHRVNDGVADAERIAAASTAAGQALETLCGLFFEHTRFSVTPLPAHFAKLVLVLLPRVSAAQRAEVARRLAHSDALPREIARAIACDYVEVAGPVLRQSPVLDEDILMAAAAGEDPARARCVAARTNLPSPIAVALARRGDPAIAEEMLSGPAYPIDPEVAELLAETPVLSASATERLVIWSELSTQAMARVFWWAQPRTRRVIVERSARRGAVHTRSGSGEATANLELGTALFAAAASRRWSDLVAQLGAALNIPRSLAMRLIEDPTGEALVVGCRAAGVGVSQLTSLLVLMPSVAGPEQPQSHIRNLVMIAEHLPVSVAGDIVRMWRSPQERGPAQHKPAAVEAQRTLANPSPRPAGQAGGFAGEVERISLRR